MDDTEFTPVHELIKSRSEQFPDAIACNFENTETCTYRELWDRVLRIKRILPNRSDGDEAICILLNPGIERIPAMLAVLVSGFAYVPLDTGTPASRNAFIVGDCGARAVLSKDGILQDLPANVILLDAEPLLEERAPKVAHSDLAYILYTSGSTGNPKGVEITHEALSISMREHRRVYELDENSRLLQVSPWTFDISVADIFGTLSAGGTLCLGSKNFLMSDLAGAIRSMSVTHISPTPTLAEFLTPDNAPSLRVLAVGGEPMTEKIRDVWASKATLLNCYGPTEATVDVICQRVTANTPPNMIGKPLKDTIAYILNDHLSPMPFGGVGQLAISGPQLARGYRNRPLENKAFVQHDVLGRIYLTGDLASMDRNGSITLFGRVDSQIKLRGQRIEPGEIEAKMVAAGAKRAVAVLSPDKSGIVAAFDGGSWQNLKSAIGDSLPRYFLPKYWVPMTIPINRNDKVDRKAVADHIASLDLSEYTAEAPKSGTGLSGEKERVLARAMQKSLGISKTVYGDSNFFALSGDSISALRLVTLARSEDLNFTIVDLYRNPTVSQLAAVAKRSKGFGEEDISKLASSALFPLSVPRRTAFFIHPVSGLCLDFRLIASYIPELDIIGVSDPHFGETDIYTSLLHMAKVYASIIAYHQPAGPYLILGYSFGGHVAIEIARILRSRGQDVGLVLVDIDRSPEPPLPPGREQKHVKELIEEQGWAGYGDDLSREVARNVRLIDEYSRIGKSRFYDGPATLLRIDGGDGGYRELIQDLKVDTVYGDHYTIFTDETHLRRNAEVLKNVFRSMEAF